MLLIYPIKINIYHIQTSIYKRIKFIFQQIKAVKIRVQKTISYHPNKCEVSNIFQNSLHFKDHHSHTFRCSLLSLNHRAKISIESVEQSDSSFDVYVKTNLNCGLCHYCGEISLVHSKNYKTITDLLIQGKKVIQRMQT